MIEKAYGYRTLAAGIFGMVCLVGGLWLLAKDHRHEAYFAFATGVGAIVASLAAKSVGESAVGGDGLKGGVQNLLTAKKPGDPPTP
jgi:hypothetical protein